MGSRRQGGFTLVELAIVILIMGLLLGGLMMPLAAQRDAARARDGLRQIEAVRAAIDGFLLANGHLPCPATPASAGYASPAVGNCSVQHGFVPATTLDLTGSRNADNLLLDPWGSPLRYSVSASDTDGDGNWDYASSAELRDVSLAALDPDLVVCSTASGASSTACSGNDTTLAERAPYVVYSLGKDWASFSSADQLANVGATLGGGASGASYPVAGDTVFVMRDASASAGNAFDDVVEWAPPGAVAARLVDGGHLP